MEAPLVVGYKGEIGRFILAGLLEDMPKANDILCVDVSNSDQDVTERIEKADTIFLCVPLQATQDWLNKFCHQLGGKIVVEQTSLKSFLYESSQYAGIQFVSMHLLFRPSATPVTDRRCLMFSSHVGADTVGHLTTTLGRALKCQMTILEDGQLPAYALHDQMMATQQALIHRVVLCLAETLVPTEAQTFVGQRVVELAERIRAGDPVLYQMIQANPYLALEVESFIHRLVTFLP